MRPRKEHGVGGRRMELWRAVGRAYRCRRFRPGMTGSDARGRPFRLLQCVAMRHCGLAECPPTSLFLSLTSSARTERRPGWRSIPQKPLLFSECDLSRRFVYIDRIMIWVLVCVSVCLCVCGKELTQKENELIPHNDTCPSGVMVAALRKHCPRPNAVGCFSGQSRGGGKHARGTETDFDKMRHGHL